MSQCVQCGTQNRDNARFCQKCGGPLAQAPAPGAAQPAKAGPAPVPAPAQPAAPQTPRTPAGSSGVGPAPATSAPAAPQRSAQPAKPAPGIPAPPIPPASPPAPAQAQPTSGQQPQRAPAARPEPVPLGMPVAAVATVPLGLPDFAPLPPGALVDQRRDEVVSVLTTGSKLNVYIVEDTQSRRCPACGSTASRSDDQFCSDCGASFTADAAARPRYLLRETLDRDLLAVEAKIAEMGLRHPGILNVNRFFEECPYGKLTRFYLVSEPEEGSSLASLPRPQPEAKVVAWGRQLAEALAYLHEHNIVFHARILPENIRIIGDDAKLTNLGRSHFLKPVAQDMIAEDVAALARLLRDLLDQQADPAVKAIFDAGLTAPGYRDGHALAKALPAAAEATPAARNLTLLTGRRSDVGCQREHNEDSLVTLELERVQLSTSKPIGLFAVADGMGGHAAGEVASGLVINNLARAVVTKMMAPALDDPSAAEPDYGALLKDACQEAARSVYDHSRKTRSDMGSTLVAALVVGNAAYVINVGDSRGYLLTASQIKQITADHSVVERLVATGQITRAEARNHPQRNLVYRTMGDKPQVEPDLFTLTLADGDALLLCSDGLHGMVEDEAILEAASAQPHPQAACQALVDLANQAGGDDNITVVMVKALGVKDERG